MANHRGPIDRRTFLRGAGVACALPWLEAMSPRPGARRDDRPRRLCFVYFPNGAAMPGADDAKNGDWNWFPRGEGRDYQFTKVLQPLAPFRDRMSLFGGLSHPLSRELLGHMAGDTWLTAGDMRGDTYKNRVSVDQVAAHRFKTATRFPSLVLSTDGGVGYKSRVSTLSFDFTGKPMPSEHRPRQIFERYFGAAGAGNAAARRQSIQQGKKVVDLVLEDSKQLHARLGKHDQTKLDEYLASLNSVEEQIRRNEAWLDVPMKPFDASGLQLDAAANIDPQAYLRSMFDLMVLALQTDLTRVITFMTGREDGMGFADNFPNLALGIKRGHHTISHDTHEGHWEQWGSYDQWHAKQFAHFLERLATTRDEHGPLLDSTLTLYGSCCSTTHNARNLPLLLAGGGDFDVKHGEFRRYGEDVPMSNLLLGMLHAVGLRDESFGDSTGVLHLRT
ncbi:MAG: DUF1552 domain-containing protein [Planctomycetes bacterium]|nr:DUF1552 domain-containing protein [Planctomycetota bacterium]MCB9887720.1 DUF1552 domain-containing protein [Planctomycetota bacterium]